MRVMQRRGNYQLTVFSSPNPLRAGPIDLSVLIQDMSTRQAVTNATIDVKLTPADDSLPPIRSMATTAAATNKLLYAALVDLPAAGRWDVRVECIIPQTNGKTQVHTDADFTMEVAAPLPRWLVVWPWFSWPVIAIVLFAIRLRNRT